MKKKDVKQFQMLGRLNAFEHTHEARFPEGGEARTAFGIVAAAVAEIERLTHDTRTGRRLSRDEKLEARQSLLSCIGDIQRAARVMAKATPDADAKFPPPAGMSELEILQTGQLFLKEAGPMKDAFIRCGLPDSFVDDLQTAVSGFEKAIAGRRAGRTGSKVSQLAIRRALRRGMDAVDSLDVLVPIALRNDHAALDQWVQDRRVERVKSTNGSSDEPTPASTAPATPADSVSGVAAVAVTASAEDPLQKAS